MFQMTYHSIKNRIKHMSQSRLNLLFYTLEIIPSPRILDFTSKHFELYLFDFIQNDSSENLGLHLQRF